MSLRRQALLPLALVLTTWLAYGWLIGAAVGPVPGLLLGLIYALALLTLVGLVLAAWRARRATRSLAAFSQHPPSRDRLVTLRGHLEPIAEPAAAPLSGEDCVAWRYRFELASQDEHGETLDDITEWFGMGQVACALRMPYGPIAIEAGMLLTTATATDQRLEDGEARRRATLLRELPRLEVLSGAADLGTLLARLDELLVDPDGDTRVDCVRGNWPHDRPTGEPRELRETAVRAGSDVVVQGQYSATRRAIVVSRHGVTLEVANRPGGVAPQSGQAVQGWLVLVLLAINVALHVGLLYLLHL